MKKPTILVVDDDEIIRVLLVDLFHSLGSKVIVLENGSQVLQVMEAESPDVLISDLIMDEKEGLETIAEVRRLYPALPIIAISSNAEYLPFARDLGADQIFSKPLNTHRLLEYIQSL